MPDSDQGRVVELEAFGHGWPFGFEPQSAADEDEQTERDLQHLLNLISAAGERCAQDVLFGEAA